MTSSHRGIVQWNKVNQGAEKSLQVFFLLIKIYRLSVDMEVRGERRDLSSLVQLKKKHVEKCVHYCETEKIKNTFKKEEEEEETKLKNILKEPSCRAL